MVGLLAPLLGAVVSGGANLLGSTISANTSNRAARLNAIFQAQQNAQAQALQDKQFNQTRDDQMAINAQARDDAGYQFGTSSTIAQYQFQEALRAAATDRALQKEFAQNGVQWRAQDARMAGLHPLAAMGAQLASSSPVQVGGSVPSGSVPHGSAVSAPTPITSQISPFAGASGVGSALSSFGQDISRAMTAVSTEWERTHGVQAASQQLALENQALQNKYLAAQIAKTTGAAVGPPFPSSRGSNQMPGQGNTPSRLVEVQPHKPVAGNPVAPQAEPGDITDLGYARTATGYVPVPSKDVKERIEDNIISETIWEIRNRLMPMIGQGTPPYHVKIPKGKEWWWNPLYQEYQVRNKPFWRGGSVPEPVVTVPGGT